MKLKEIPVGIAKDDEAAIQPDLLRVRNEVFFSHARK
jgi:hypothetical protein